MNYVYSTKEYFNIIDACNTPHESAKMSEVSGFKILEMYGNFEVDDLSVDLPQIITVTKKLKLFLYVIHKILTENKN